MNLVLVDGHNFLFKSWAVPFKFRSPSGTPLHVVSTFLSLLRRAVKASGECSNLVVTFDSEEQNSNNLLYEEYKANRNYDYSAFADSPFEHLPIIQKALTELSISWLEQPGIEADDVIATLATRHCHQNLSHKALIASSDSDFYQLLSPQVQIIKFLPKGAWELIGPEYVKAKYNIGPEEYTELKSWVGDKADNIRGIDGIGWKRGAEIIRGERTRALSTEEQALLERNRKLICLNCGLPIEFPQSDLSKLQQSNNEIFRLCQF